MAKQLVMNATGDTRYEFDPTDAAALAKASTRFKELTGAATPQRCAGVRVLQSSFGTSILLPMRQYSSPGCEAVS